MALPKKNSVFGGWISSLPSMPPPSNRNFFDFNSRLAVSENCPHLVLQTIYQSIPQSFCPCSLLDPLQPTSSALPSMPWPLHILSHFGLRTAHRPSPGSDLAVHDGAGRKTTDHGSLEARSWTACHAVIL